MRSLLIESLPGCGRAVEARLRDAGHDVVRCHPPDHPLFPCKALTTGCPLDDPAGVDAIIAVRTPTEPDQTISEMGVTCALRRHTPVVVVGSGHPDPFGDRVHRSEEHDVLAACASAVATAHEEIVGPLRAEARRLVARSGVDTSRVDVSVSHEAGRTQIEIMLPPDSGDIDELVATHVHAHYRPLAGHDRTVDIEVAHLGEE